MPYFRCPKDDTVMEPLTMPSVWGMSQENSNPPFHFMLTGQKDADTKIYAYWECPTCGYVEMRRDKVAEQKYKTERGTVVEGPISTEGLSSERVFTEAQTIPPPDHQSVSDASQGNTM